LYISVVFVYFNYRPGEGLQKLLTARYSSPHRSGVLVKVFN